MQIDSIKQVSRQKVQDEVLALIKSRAKPASPAQKAADGAIGEKAAGTAGPVRTEAAVHEINEALKILSTRLRFEVDQDSGRVMVKVIDRDSGDVLRQIPSEAALQIARSLDKLVGHLLNQAI
jgi:flagellar protein FlaG